MRWSFSSARAFRQCQRGWFYKTCLASARAKDPERRAAYLLSKLQTVSAWRGKLVDRVLSQELVGALRRGEKPTKGYLISVAKKCFDSELEFALAHRIREPGAGVSSVASMPAFRAIEYGEVVTETETATAWQDVEAAIENLFKMDNLRAALKTASYLVAQRSLQFELAGVTVIAVPDVVAFRQDQPPFIVDWKVHAFGTRDYRLQLALYAMALARCNPHRDFPRRPPFESKDVRLIEAQLLAGLEHEYRLDERDFDELEDYVAASATEMLAATAGLKNGDMNAEDFAVTEWAELCQKCVFKRVCWEKPPDGES